jgi:apolipoprotein N-acyltransferase
MAMRGLHLLNCFLYFLNALLWALMTKQPGLAVIWLSVAIFELLYIRMLVREGEW